MATQFFIQKGIELERDIESYFKITVMSVRGLNPPEPKELFTREWANEHGIDVYMPNPLYSETRKRKSSDVTITIHIKDDTDTAIDKYRAFCDYIFEGLITYRDTLQNQTVSLVYNGNKPSWYNFVGNKSLVAEITFLNPTGAVTKY